MEGPQHNLLSSTHFCTNLENGDVSGSKPAPPRVPTLRLPPPLHRHTRLRLSLSGIHTHSRTGARPMHVRPPAGSYLTFPHPRRNPTLALISDPPDLRRPLPRLCHPRPPPTRPSPPPPPPRRRSLQPRRHVPH